MNPLEFATTIGSGLSAIAAVAALIIAAAALRATRRAAVAGHLLEALSELVASIQTLVDLARSLDKLGPAGEQRSREQLQAEFRRLAVANTKLELLEPSLSNSEEYGTWVRSAANNLAANLLQADEFADFTRYAVTSADPTRQRPEWVEASDWLWLQTSMSFLAVQHLAADLGEPVYPGSAEPLDRAWAVRVMRTRGDTRPSVYSPHSSYLVQMSRLLDDFTREYVVPWAASLVGKGILGKRVKV